MSTCTSTIWPIGSDFVVKLGGVLDSNGNTVADAAVTAKMLDGYGFVLVQGINFDPIPDQPGAYQAFVTAIDNMQPDQEYTMHITITKDGAKAAIEVARMADHTAK